MSLEDEIKALIYEAVDLPPAFMDAAARYLDDPEAPTIEVDIWSVIEVLGEKIGRLNEAIVLLAQTLDALGAD